MNKEIRILIADSEEIVRAGLTSMLGSTDDIRVIGEAADTKSTIEKALRLRPDIIIMEIFIPGSIDIDAIRKIKTDFPEAKVLVFTGSDDNQDFILSQHQEIHGYLSKAASSKKLIRTLRNLAK
jgi:two-component system, NarL family, invasion response regulator UvrY